MARCSEGCYLQVAAGLRKVCNILLPYQLENTIKDDKVKKSIRASGEFFLYSSSGLGGFEFTTGNVYGSRAVVCIPGLTDGLLNLHYLPLLASRVETIGWRVFQPLLSSSYGGWGCSSLTQDAAEMDAFINFLSSHKGIEGVVLLGHSTGCQDAVHFMRGADCSNMIRGMILQAAVSDREALACHATSETRELLMSLTKIAQDLKNDGKEFEILPISDVARCLQMPRHPVSARRFLSLTGRLTQDDMFSSDLSELELKGCLGHIQIPTLIAQSLKDEFVPAYVDIFALGSRLAAAFKMQNCKVVFIEDGDHALRDPAAADVFINCVLNFLQFEVKSVE